MAQSGPLSSDSLWGDAQFADATIVMGDKSWKVHRWVICKQSEYFMKALEGAYKEARDKTIYLVDTSFAADDVEAMLKFLYTNKLQPRHDGDSLTAYGVANYFGVKGLRIETLAALKKGLKRLVDMSYWRNYRKYAMKILQEYASGDLELALAEVTAEHIEEIIHNSGAWDEIVQAHPKFANQVLKVRFPKPKTEAKATGKKSSKPASTAFDDLHRFDQGGAGHRYAPY